MTLIVSTADSPSLVHLDITEADSDTILVIFGTCTAQVLHLLAPLKTGSIDGLPSTHFYHYLQSYSLHCAIFQIYLSKPPIDFDWHRFDRVSSAYLT